MKLLPIRIAIAFGEWTLFGATILDREGDEQPEVVRNPTPFGFQVTSDEVADELELHLDPEGD